MVFDPQVPPTDVTLDNLAHITIAMERAAAATYCRLAEDMKNLHNPDAVKVFEQLIEIERDHEREITAWADALSLTRAIPTDDVSVDDEPSEQTTVTAPGTRANLALTPWQALNMAVTKEQNAFEFLSSIAANAKRDDVRHEAENFASKKLEHIALLRLERKRAYHTDERARLEAIVGSEIPTTLGAFDTSAIRLMNGLAVRYLELADESAKAADDTSAALLRQLAASVANTSTPPTLSKAKGNAAVAATLRAALRETEVAFDGFITVAERAEGEDIVEAAQGKASDCVALLERLGDRLTDHIENLP